MLGKISKDKKNILNIPYKYKGEEIGNVRIDTRLFPLAILHFEISQFNHNIFKEIKYDFHNRVIPLCKKLGFRRILSMAGDGVSDIDKWKRFMGMVGFDNPETFHMADIGV